MFKFVHKKKRTLRVLFIRLDSGQLASENFQFGPSVRHSQELLTLIWCSNCYNPVPASPGHLTARQWMIKLQAELSLAGLNKEKLSEITLQSSLISDNKVGWESWDKLRTLYNVYHYYENFHCVYEYLANPRLFYAWGIGQLSTLIFLLNEVWSLIKYKYYLPDWEGSR